MSACSVEHLDNQPARRDARTGLAALLGRLHVVWRDLVHLRGQRDAIFRERYGKILLSLTGRHRLRSSYSSAGGSLSASPMVSPAGAPLLGRVRDLLKNLYYHNFSTHSGCRLSCSTPTSDPVNKCPYNLYSEADGDDLAISQGKVLVRSPPLRARTVTDVYDESKVNPDGYESEDHHCIVCELRCNGGIFRLEPSN